MPRPVNRRVDDDFNGRKSDMAVAQVSCAGIVISYFFYITPFFYELKQKAFQNRVYERHGASMALHYYPLTSFDLAQFHHLVCRMHVDLCGIARSPVLTLLSQVSTCLFVVWRYKELRLTLLSRLSLTTFYAVFKKNTLAFLFMIASQNRFLIVYIKACLSTDWFDLCLHKRTSVSSKQGCSGILPFHFYVAQTDGLRIIAAEKAPTSFKIRGHPRLIFWLFNRFISFPMTYKLLSNR